MQIMTQYFHRYSSIASILCALAILLISFSNISNGVLNTLGTNDIQAENRAFLDTSAAENHKDILRLAEILAVVKLVSTTDIGVNLIIKAEIEVGQALHGLIRSIEYALWVVLASSVTIEVWKILVETAEIFSLFFLRATLLAFIFYLLANGFCRLNKIREVCFVALKFNLMFFLSTYLLVPYALNLTAWLSQGLLHSNFLAQKKGLHLLHATIESAGKGVELTQYWSNGKTMRSHLIDLHRDVQPHTSNVFEFMVNSFAANLMTGVIVPLVSFYLLWKMLVWSFSLIEVGCG